MRDTGDSDTPGTSSSDPNGSVEREMRKALRHFDRKRKAEGVETLLETSLNLVQCQGIWENIQVLVQEIEREINVTQDEDGKCSLALMPAFHGINSQGTILEIEPFNV